ncbi:MAG: glycosyltransferase family 9 protein [Acidobacteriota bacterium]|nr:glycosyltransferase family 9 protein [Acidobacteriota bacterium]MDE3170458.1 glycosyltransferase family 9 protein [Acidobacteriota bacterium]
MTVPSEQKFLIVRLSSLGDLVHTIPAVAALRSAFPAAQIDWVVDRRWSPLVELVTCVDHVIPLDRGPRDVLALIARLRRARYGCALDLQGRYRSAVLGWLSGAPRRIGRAAQSTREPGAALFYTERVVPSGRHISDMTIDLALRAGAKPSAVPEFPLRVPLDAAQHVRERLAREGVAAAYVVMSPGGGWKSKCWPPERFGALAAAIERSHHLPAIINIAPGEEAMAREIIRGAAPAKPVALSLDIHELAALLAEARLVIAGDTGPLHLAAALGTRVIGLFGTTDPQRNGPLPRGLVVQAASDPSQLPDYVRGDYVRQNSYSPVMLAISVNRVLAAVEQEITVIQSA